MRRRAMVLLLLRRAHTLLLRPRPQRRLATRRFAALRPLPRSRCDDVLDFWFAAQTKQHWFASTPSFDREVADTFGGDLAVIADADAAAVAAWAGGGDADAVLAHVLLWDQVARHVARVDADVDPAAYGPLAVAASRALLNADAADAWPASRQSFALMPLRHTFDARVLAGEVLPRLRAWAPGDDAGLWRRFEAATLKALLSAETAAGAPPARPPAPPRSWDAFADVLEACPPIRGDAAPEDRAGFTRLDAVRGAKGFLTSALRRDDAPKRLVVSVSGGVDSVVLLYVVARVLAAPEFSRVDLVAVHVDYGNRATSGREAEFVEAYCAWLGVSLWTRRVRGCPRGSVDRAAYEELTRAARFETYAAAAGDGGVVLLGHNRDDTLENLFSNVCKGRNYDELRGMRTEGAERGVATWRPLLGTDKAAIYAAAAFLDLPHLKDSTDPACDRGRLRDDWLPAVREKQPLLLPGLERLADHLAFLREAQNRETARYFAERVAYARDGDGFVESAALPLEAWMADAPPSFWVDAFHRLAAETPARPRPSNKALANFCDWLRRALPRRRPTTCELGAAFRAALEFRGDEAPVLTVRYLRAP